MDAIKDLSFGSKNRQVPGGLEGISVAIAGDGLKMPLSKAILEVADAIRDLAEAVRAE